MPSGKHICSTEVWHAPIDYTFRLITAYATDKTSGNASDLSRLFHVTALHYLHTNLHNFVKNVGFAVSHEERQTLAMLFKYLCVNIKHFKHNNADSLFLSGSCLSLFFFWSMTLTKRKVHFKVKHWKRMWWCKKSVWSSLSPASTLGGSRIT